MIFKGIKSKSNSIMEEDCDHIDNPNSFLKYIKNVCRPKERLERGAAIRTKLGKNKKK